MTFYNRFNFENLPLAEVNQQLPVQVATPVQLSHPAPLIPTVQCPTVVSNTAEPSSEEQNAIQTRKRVLGKLFCLKKTFPIILFFRT